MGIMTLSVDEKTEENFRAIARKKYGKKKGALQKTFQDAIKLLKERELESELAKLLEKGLPIRLDLTREEMHDRD